MLPSHFIVSMQGGKTKNSASPMWRCTCADGERVNVFKHIDENKNSARLFAEAGYLDDMLTLGDGQYMLWKTNPIGVVLDKSADGKWWEVKAVLPRPAGVKPDPLFKPDLDWYKRKAQILAKTLTLEPAVYFDVETTGLDNDAEIISIAGEDFVTGHYLYTLVRPNNLAAAAKTQDIHGISIDELTVAPTLTDKLSLVDCRPLHPVHQRLTSHIEDLLYRRQWVGYNPQFDVHMLDLAYMRAGLFPLVSTGVHDAMQIYSWYAGLWDETFQRWQHVKLVDAAALMLIDTTDAHNALADVRMTHQLIQKIGEEAEL